MINYKHLYTQLSASTLAPWLETLPEKINTELTTEKHGRLNEWLGILEELPNVKTTEIDFDQALIKIGTQAELSNSQHFQLEKTLRKLHPWRKGPYDLFGIKIDTEWRSDWKWDRLKDHIQPLAGRLVLDVGCGSGYHCWRMLGAGAKQVIGIEPTLLYVMQFHAIKHFTDNLLIDVLPQTLEDLPENLQAFDSVFSMGVLYHRRSPIDHLFKLHSCLRPGGELILETLIIDGNDGKVFMPEGRYAKMRNVWFIPDIPTLITWLKRSRFNDIKVVDATPTTTEEQRQTDWMKFESLADFLDPHNPTKTIEGHPGPIRAILVAKAE